MNLITRIVLCFLLLHTCALAEKLEITVDQNTIKLPYWVANEPHHGAVIIVKGGEIPEWSTLLARFAQKLTHYGWSSVILNSKKTNSPWITQIPEAISELRQKNNQRIILVHYGDQLNQSLEYFSKPQAKMINGLIMISAYDDKKNLEKTSSFRFPLFDIVGQFDYERVHQQKRLRSKLFKQPNYLAVEMPGAQHDYEYSQKLLVAFVHGWMAKLPETRTEPVPVLTSYLVPINILISHIASIDGFHTDS